MNELKSFFQMVYLLEQCYPSCKEDDTGVFLSSISPDICDHGMPVDMAIFNDWKENFCDVCINCSNLKKTVMAFLLFYENNFGFSFFQLKEYLNKCEHSLVENAIKKAEKAISERITV